MITLLELQSAFDLADDNDDGLITFEDAIEAVQAGRPRFAAPPEAHARFAALVAELDARPARNIRLLLVLRRKALIKAQIKEPRALHRPRPSPARQPKTWP